MTVNMKDDQARVEGIFAAFNESWRVYWDAYVELQNQLYESVKAAREVSWLAAKKTKCLKLIDAIEVIRGKIAITKQGLQTKP